MTMGTVSHVEKSKKYLVKDVHRLARLGVWLEDSPNCGFVFHHNSESSLVFKMMYKQHLDPLFIELDESFLLNLESFSLGGLSSYIRRLYFILVNFCGKFEFFGI